MPESQNVMVLISKGQQINHFSMPYVHKCQFNAALIFTLKVIFANVLAFSPKLNDDSILLNNKIIIYSKCETFV